MNLDDKTFNNQHMTYRKCLGFVAFCLLIEGCEKENVAPIEKTVPILNNIGDSPNIYIAGETKNSSIVWKNGTADTLAYNSVAQSVFVDRNDTYVAGWDWNLPGKAIAMYWKNGTPVPLSNGTTDSYAKSIVVSGNDVYVTGFGNGNKIVARCWKNGIPMPLASLGGNHTVAVSSFVSGSDIYVVGWVFDSNDRTRAAYWKNGQLILLTDGTSDCMAESIFVSGDDVYVAGTVNSQVSHILPTEIFSTGQKGVATYWKNGENITLSTNGRAQSIFVNGTDVYVSGSIYNAENSVSTPFGQLHVNTAIYWKNNIPVSLVEDSNSNAYSISVTKNGDVYTAGWIDNQAVYWINDTATHLPIPYQGQGYLYSIFLTN
jgi:hypothetical protein